MRLAHVFLGALLVLISPFEANAQSQGRPARIAVLMGALSPQVSSPWVDAFRDELGRLGYVDGRQVDISVVYTSSQYGSLARLAAELVRGQAEIGRAHV